MEEFEGIDILHGTDDFVDRHDDGLLTWKAIKDGLVELIDCIVLWAEDGAVKEVLVWMATLCDSRIECIDQSADGVVSQSHVSR